VCGRGVLGCETFGGGGLCLSGSWISSMSCLLLRPDFFGWVGRMCGLGLIVLMVGTWLSRLIP